MAYVIFVPRSLQKRVARLPAIVRERIDAAVQDLADDPRPPGSRKLSDRGGEWRIRVGPYRIIYLIDDVEQTIVLLEVWHRQRGYR